MRIVVFGLSISSAWGNGHATLLRGLFRALHNNGHKVHFFEKDVPYYASHRDSDWFPFVDLRLYSDWTAIANEAAIRMSEADAAIVTSYCPDGVIASRLVTESSVPRKIFYDMDAPVTLHRLEKGETVEYLPPEGLGAFDLVLSYTGGEALVHLQNKLHARRVAPLYGWVDPEIHHPTKPVPEFESHLSYLGTYAADRQQALEELLIRPAHELPNCKFLVAGAMFPRSENRPSNLRQLDHLPPEQHPAFFSSSRLTLNVTRASMAAMGYCPSGRFFEAAACGCAVLSDWWTGLDTFFEPGREILIAKSSADSREAILQDSRTLKGIAARAKDRTLSCYTAEVRARELIDLIEASTNQEIKTAQTIPTYEGI